MTWKELLEQLRTLEKTENFTRETRVSVLIPDAFGNSNWETYKITSIGKEDEIYLELELA